MLSRSKRAGAAVALAGATTAAMALLLACGRKGHESEPAPIAVAPDAAQETVASNVERDGATQEEDAAPPPEDAGPIPLADAAALRKRPRLVLHAGDSMVGGAGGLNRGLESRFRALGSRFIRDVWERVGIVQFAREERFPKLVKDLHPDVVVLTLGANDVFTPHPDALVRSIATIAKHASKADCYWITPPLWKGDLGLTKTIQEAAAPCRVFDSSELALERKGDRIHPNDAGGEVWAANFWTFYEAIGPFEPLKLAHAK